MDPRHRHHYEVIQEVSRSHSLMLPSTILVFSAYLHLILIASQGLPCHMYFDLEFNQKENEGKNVDDMVDILISVILEALHEKFAIEGQEDWIVELDSSTKGTVIYMLSQLLVDNVVSFLIQLYFSVL